MHRIEEIKEVFHGKSPLSVVAADWQECQTCRCLPKKTHTSDDTLHLSIRPKTVKYNNKQDAKIVIVCPQKIRQSTSAYKKQCLLCFGMMGILAVFHSPYRQKSNPQSKKYILMGDIPWTLQQCQVKRKLGQQGKQEKPQCIVSAASRVKETFNHQKTKNRKCYSSDETTDFIDDKPRYGERSDREAALMG